MRKIILLALLFLLSNIVYAADLSDYPNLLIKNGLLNVSLVVGDGSSASNVLAQATVSASLSAIGGEIKNKLASEIEDLNQNIVSFGNPCINEITSNIMYDPNPCDKSFANGQAYIILYKYNDSVHIVVAGYRDIGTRKAAEYLANYEKNPVSGNIAIINVPEEKPAVAVNAPEKIEKESANQPNLSILSIDMEAEKNKIIEELNKKILNKTYEDDNQKTVADTTQKTKVINWNEDKSIEEPQKNKKDNIFKKIIKWITLWFR